MEQEQDKKRKYSKISLKKRELLVKLILDQEFTIARAAKRVNLKPSTARMILNKYKATGTFPHKNFKKNNKVQPTVPPKTNTSLKKEEELSEQPYLIIQEQVPRETHPQPQTQNTQYGAFPPCFMPQWISQLNPFAFTPCFYP